MKDKLLNLSLENSLAEQLLNNRLSTENPTEEELFTDEGLPCLEEVLNNGYDKPRIDSYIDNFKKLDNLLYSKDMEVVLAYIDFKHTGFSEK